MFTASGKREFVPRDQAFPLLVVNVCLVRQTKLLVSHYFHPKKLILAHPRCKNPSEAHE